MTKRLIEEKAATSPGAFGSSAMQIRALVVCCHGNAIPRGLPSRPLTGSAAWHLVASESNGVGHFATLLKESRVLIAYLSLALNDK